MKNFNQIKINKFLLTIFLSLLLVSCGKGAFKNIGKTDSRKISPNANERAQKNIQDGRGFRLRNLTGNQSGVFDFATSNEMWRASIELLDFTPLSNVDYSGGIIITDWFSKNNSPKDSMKITIKFLSNEIRADGIKITIHERTCIDVNTCSIEKVESKISEEIKLAILREATLLKENELVKNPDYKDPRIKD